MRKFAISLSKILLASYVGLSVFMYAFQRNLIYFPPPAESAELASSTKLEVEGAVLRISVRPIDSDKALIYFGGNAENVAYSLPELAAAFPDHSLYLMHYRGYSGSTGSPTEAKLHADARALYDLVHDKHPKVTVVGRSLGTNVAIRLASTVAVEKLALVTPFDSLLNLACNRFPFLPVRWLLVDRFESIRHAPAITAPTWILAAAEDEIIPLESTKKLFNAFKPDVASMQIIENVGHNSISDSEEYPKVLAKIEASQRFTSSPD